MIEYHSTKPMSVPGGYRTIHVEAKEKGYHGLRVRTRAGYYPKTRIRHTERGRAGATLSQGQVAIVFWVRGSELAGSWVSVGDDAYWK